MSKRNRSFSLLAEEYRLKALKAIEGGKMEKAVGLLEEAAYLFSKGRDYYMYARCLNLLGVTYANAGVYTMSEDCYLAGLECAKSRKLNGILPLFYNNIGSKYQEMGRHETAISYFETALKGFRTEESSKEERNSF